VANLRHRAEELDSIADRQEWTIKVVFVASSFNFDVPAPEDIDGFQVSYEFITICDALQTGDVSDPTARSAFTELVVEPLRGRNTPDRVRKRLLDLSRPSTPPPTG